MSALKTFQQLLRTLFQFDCADLDFGLYRILNYKRERIDAFIVKRLPQIVDKEFADYAATDKAAMEQKIEQVRQQIRESIGEQAFDKQGKLKPEFRETPLGKQYLAQCDKQAKYEIAGELKTRVYNDLYNFFSRYYEDGDFVSKRRYGHKEAYAIPYNGEEVMLHWANKDQYYIKTGEQFKTYRFKIEGCTVTFELRNADTEQNNNKGHKRYFVLAGKNPVQRSNGLLQIFFEYRPLTEKEQKSFGKNEQQRPQENLNEMAAHEILKQVKNSILKALKTQTEQEQTLLLKHLTQFTRKNTSDFFIHKDLRSFLRREMDFYLKNEVLLLDELLNAANPELATHRVLQGHVIRKAGEAIIDFLAQLEDFQRRLFEKKKFVVQTEYCLTLDRVPEALWDEVLGKKIQIAEWQNLFALDKLLLQAGKKKPDKAFLKANPKLVVDTRHFSEDFKWRLLSHFDELDNALGGVLVKSENFQALNLLLEKYRESAKCVHIDPPYNTDTSGFLYANAYQHSSWLTMMENRISMARKFMENDGSFLCHVDENEYENLYSLFRAQQFEYLGTAVWDKRNPMMGGNGIAVQHEYIIWGSKHTGTFNTSSENATAIIDKANELIAKYGGVSAECRKEFSNWVKQNENLSGGEKSYQFINGDGRVYQSVGMSWPNPNPAPKEFFTPLIHPVTKKPCPVPPSGWSRSPEKMQELSKKDEIIFGIDETTQPRRKIFLTKSTSKPISSVIQNGQKGKSELEKLGLEFSYCHPVSLYENLFFSGMLGETEGLLIDFFGGSGTTAHAIISLNHKDKGRRKYILVEMGDYFETVLLQRIKKVVFCENWKDGKPVGGKSVSHFVKYQTLEQYEDTLNNLALLREKDGQKTQQKFGDDYLLRYMLEFETQGSPCLLNLEMMKNPFDYRLKVREGDEIVEHTVDLVETFNYLIGIQVKKMRSFENNGHSYRAVSGEQSGKNVVIIWRPLNGLEESKTALRRDKQFIEDEVLPALLGNGVRTDRLLVNGACYVENAEAIEPEFKRLMFTEIA